MTPDFTTHILRTLLYYEMFDHPLTRTELFTLHPVNSLTERQFSDGLDQLVAAGTLGVCDGFYYRAGRKDLPAERIRRERIAGSKLKIARFMGQIIKRFPFVRAVFISGDLSKGVATRPSDIDYVIVTAPGRLWICRTALVLFKKIFLLNSKKYFCVNYFISQDHLEVQFRNYYTATEIAHVKPLVNLPLFLRFMNANTWIKTYFPNYAIFALATDKAGTPSMFSRILGLPFYGRWADRMDTWLMEQMIRHWQKRYPEINTGSLAQAFTSTKQESLAFGGNFSSIILDRYAQRLREYHIDGPNAAL